MIVNCDECNEDIEVDLKEEEVDPGVIKYYFNCTSCNHLYISHYENDKIRAMQEIQRSDIERLGEYRREGRNTEARKLNRKIKRELTRIVRVMDKLKADYH